MVFETVYERIKEIIYLEFIHIKNSHIMKRMPINRKTNDITMGSFFHFGAYYNMQNELSAGRCTKIKYSR